MAITFNKTAGSFGEALPIGNGRLGAMIYGGTRNETILLNQDSIWYGAPVDRTNPQAGEYLDKVRQLIFSGRIPEAQDLMRYTFSGIPQSERPYQMLGEARIAYRNIGKEISGYQRSLLLEEGIVQEHFIFKQGTQEYLIEKEYLASNPLGVLVIHLKAQHPILSLEILLRRGRFYEHAGGLDEHSIYMDGTLGQGGICFLAGIGAAASDGTVSVMGEHLLVKDASEVTLYISCETSFYCDNPEEEVRKKLLAAKGRAYGEIRKQHVEDYRQLYGRTTLCLEGEENTYAQEYFQYGRYLMISGSRPGSLPLNLQGIWNDTMTPPWDSKYTININTEMNYWPAEICNLPECHLPLFEHLKRMVPKGQDTARRMYGCRGFVAHHNTDIWGDCVPQDINTAGSYWVMGGAWLCTHIWKHYLYTQDRAFLKDMYDVLKESVLFFHDFLMEEDGELIVCPSVSPENSYINDKGEKVSVCAGAAMDAQILKDLMEGFLQASQVLGIQNEMVEETARILHRLPEDKIGRHGQLMEWRKDYEEAEPGHRHISHLYALYPSCRITVDKTPALAEAARRTLERRLSRGGGHTGWSCAWIVGFYARLGDGEKALENLEKLWRESTFPNRMDNHPMRSGAVFQIDGNLGASAAIAEMLVRADGNRVLLLPALPGKWASGSVSGLRLPGNASISLKWSDGALKSWELEAYQDYEGFIGYDGNYTKISVKGGETFVFCM